MTTEVISQKIMPILIKHSVKRASIFGSVLFSKKPNDIDILIQFKSGKSLFDLVDLEEKLSKKLNKRVDLATYNSLHPLIKDKILSQKKDII